MLKSKFLKKWTTIAVFIALLAAVVWAGKGIFKYNVFSTHDGLHHIARSFDAIQTSAAGEFPLRWAGSLNYFCGAPIFNFYYPLLYYLVVLINPLAKNVVLSLDVIYFLSFLIGTFAFYFWAKEETGKKIVAFSGAMVYLFAPYRFLLIYVRGSPEYLAYTIFPIVFYLYAKAFHTENKKFVWYVFLASIAGAFLTISHNFTVMFLMPIILVYLVAKVILLKLGLKKIIWVVLSFVGSFGMGSFFMGPALLEQKYTNIGSNFLMWRDHFPELWQVWNSKWGYFYSAAGTANDGMSFMLGYAQWLILALGAFFILYQFFVSRFRIGKFIKENIFILIFFIGSLLALYLILPWSIPVWEKFKPLQEIQFSWRILGVAVLTIAIMFVYILDRVKTKFILVAVGVGLSLFAVFAERNHMRPQPVSVQDLYRFDDFEHLHPERYSTTTLGDEVLPPGATKTCWFSTPPVATNSTKDKINYKLVDRNDTSANVKFEVDKKPDGDKLVLALSYFPGIFRINLNGEQVKNYSDCAGQVCIDETHLRSGANFISWTVGENQLEKSFDYLSLGFLAFWIIAIFIRFTGIYRNKRTLLLFAAGIVVFALFLFFRVDNLGNRLGFGWDQERDANAVSDILSGKLTLIGPRVQGPKGFFLPPYFFYLLAPFYALWQLSPFATGGFIVFWSVLFFASAFLILSKIFNRQVALYFLALWAVNRLAVSADTIAWNPVVIPLIELLLIYFYYLYLKKKSQLSIFLVGLVFGFGVSFHLQFLFLFPFLTPLFIDLYKSREYRGYLYFLVGIVVPFLPIFLFDIRHNFLNIKLALEFLSSGNSSVNRVFSVFSNEVGFITSISKSTILGIVFYLFLSLGFLGFVYEVKDKFEKRIFLGLGLTAILSLPLFYILIKNPSEYYFNYLLVLTFVLVAYLLSKAGRIGIIIAFVIVFYFAGSSTTLFVSHDYFLSEKNNAAMFLKEVTKGSGSFNVSFDVPSNEDSGFRYLLNYNHVSYSGDPKDSLIEFVIPANKRPSVFYLGKIGLFIPSEWIKDNWIK